MWGKRAFLDVDGVSSLDKVKSLESCFILQGGVWQKRNKGKSMVHL